MTIKISNNAKQEYKNKPWPLLTIDYALYEKVLEDSNASDEEKREFIETLWNVIVNFIDLGFEIHPLQQACEQPLDLSTLELSDVLESKEPNPHKAFAKATSTTEKEKNYDL